MRDMKFIARASLIVALLCALIAPLTTTQSASALLNSSSKQDACQALNSCNGTSAGNSLSNTIKAAINILSAIAAAVAVIMIIIGGFRYITSAGDSTGVNGAKNTIIYALVGLVIAVLAQVLVRFVLFKVR